jgi:hypothetical protein
MIQGAIAESMLVNGDGFDLEGYKKKISQYGDKNS